ncbi:MAG: TIGR03936 family radical SAM-associated protein, partial [Clostridia bacterium]|nr:TIGR03936 family radical SAM-associated protein [Clostridia bacterium]
MNSSEVVNTNIKYRIEFSKTDRMIFIGHLDLLKLFQRTFKKSGLPIGYSWGFNPHQHTTFAVPLALGVSSVGEILDIQLTEKTDCQVIKDRLNQCLPQGISILQVIELEFSAKSCASAVAYGDYCVVLDNKYDNISSVIDSMINAEEINIERVVKKKAKSVNIRPLIRSLKWDNDGEKTEIYA